jgi:hypothetical protein
VKIIHIEAIRRMKIARYNTMMIGEDRSIFLDV